MEIEAGTVQGPAALSAAAGRKCMQAVLAQGELPAIMSIWLISYRPTASHSGVNWSSGRSSGKLDAEFLGFCSLCVLRSALWLSWVRYDWVPDFPIAAPSLMVIASDARKAAGLGSPEASAP